MIRGATSIAFAAALWAVAAVPAAAAADVESLVAAERGFAAAAAKDGIRDAFLANLAEGSIVFRPGPIDARESYESREEVPGSLTWEPTYAEISRDGKLGYTTGPYRFKPDDDGEPSHGHYVSLWRRPPGQGWKVVLDTGVSHPPAADTGALEVREPEATDGSGPPGGGRGRERIRRQKAELLQHDRAFSDAAGADLVEAYRKRATEDVRIYRQGLAPTRGLEAMTATLGEASGKWSWEPAGGSVALSGDLAYTYGEAVRSGPPGTAGRSGYLRIWRRQSGDDEWKLALDLLSPYPAAAE